MAHTRPVGRLRQGAAVWQHGFMVQGRRWMVQRSARAWILGVCVAVAHLAFVAWSGFVPAFHKYGVAARALLEGSFPEERRSDFSPLYLWLTTLMEGAGLPSDRAWIVLQCVGIGLACAWLARLVGGTAGLVAALLMGLQGGLVLHASLQEPEVLLLTLLSALLWAGLTRRHAVAALCLAAAVLVRPSAAPWAALLAVQWWWGAPRRQVPWRPLAMLGGAAGAAVVVVQLWTAGAPAMNPGTVFFEGNHPASQGFSATYPPALFQVQGTTQETSDTAHVLYRDLARAELGPGATVSDVNTFWARKAWAHVQAQPGAWWQRTRHKLLGVVAPTANHDVPSLYVAEENLPPLVPWAVLLALAAASLTAGVRARRGGLLLWGLVAAQTLVMVVFYVSARQRLALLPAVTVLAGLGMRALVLSRTRALRAGVVAALVAVLSLSEDASERDAFTVLSGMQAMGRARVAGVMLERGDASHAVQQVVQAWALAPWRVEETHPAGLPVGRGQLLESAAQHALQVLPAPTSHFHAAWLALWRGDGAVAQKHLAQVPQDHALGPHARFAQSVQYFRAWAALLQGQREDARAWLLKAWAQAPEDPYVVALQQALGDAGVALDARYSQTDQHLLLGEALLLTQQPGAAREHFEWLHQRYPGWRAVTVHLAATLAASGKHDEARTLYLQAMEVATSPVVDAELLSNWAQRAGPVTSEDAAFRVQLLRQLGEVNAAAAMLQGFAAEKNGPVTP